MYNKASQNRQKAGRTRKLTFAGKRHKLNQAMRLMMTSRFNGLIAL